MVTKTLLKIQRSLNTLNKNSKCVTVCVRGHSVWTPEKTVKSSYKPIEIPNCTLYDYVWQNLDKWPERTVSVCATTGRGYTYEQAFNLSNTFAANLRKKFQVKDGDAIAVMLPNIPDYPLIAMGILEAGGLITTINPIYTAYEVQRQLSLSKSKLIITLPHLVPTVKEALKSAKMDTKIIAVRTNGDTIPEETICFNELSEDVHIDKSCLREVRRSAKDVCLLPYSSGTTGMPKGVELTNRNIVSNCLQLTEPDIAAHNETTATHQDAVMCVLPFYHIYGASNIMFHKMAEGLKLVTLDKFHPQNFLDCLEKHKINLLFTAPPLVLLMAAQGNPEKLQHLTTVINGAAPLSESDVERFFQTAGRKLDFRQGYGLTETSPVVTLTPRGMERYGCVGVPLPSTELRIVDKDMKSLGPNEKGELLIKGPQVMRGYNNNPQANAEVFTEDGWFRSGDLAIIDNDGVVTIADRLKELIKVKGFQVPPAELEAVLREHPAVSDAAVVGVPHPTSGEVPKAFVVLKEGQDAKPENICAFVREKVASYKRIEDITFLDSIPKNPTGKILRRELKEKYCMK